MSLQTPAEPPAEPPARWVQNPLQNPLHTPCKPLQNPLPAHPPIPPIGRCAPSGRCARLKKGQSAPSQPCLICSAQSGAVMMMARAHFGTSSRRLFLSSTLPRQFPRPVYRASGIEPDANACISRLLRRYCRSWQRRGNTQPSFEGLERMSVARKDKATLPSTARSAVANGSRLFVEEIDARSALARRYRDLVSEFTSDIGDDPSEAQKQLIRRAAALSTWCEAQETRLACGEDIEIGPLTTAANSLRRILQDIGLKRQTRDVLDLHAYVQQRGAA